jgi:negative regulator of flagellin synthesis FlgM
MKIPEIGGQKAPQRPDNPADRADARKTGSAKSAERDRVEVSRTARHMTELADAANALPEVRQERVAELRRAIESGSFKVDARALAAAILELEDEIFR